MISALATTPILVISMDPFFDQEEVIRSVTDPIAGEDVLGDFARLQVELSAKAQKASDMFALERRLPIPITDSLWDVEYVSGSASSYQEVTPMDLQSVLSDAQMQANESLKKKVVTTGRQTVQLTFRAKSEVVAISALRDVLEYVGQWKPAFGGPVTHVSFYSPTMCIFNAVLVGYGKSTSSDTSLSSITLSLELVDEITVQPDVECGSYLPSDSPFNTWEDLTDEQKQVLDYKRWLTEDTLKRKEDEKLIKEILKEGETAPPQIQNYLNKDGEPGTFNYLHVNDLVPGYNWFIVTDTNTISEAIVPEFRPNRTIKLNKYDLFRIISLDNRGKSRNAQGVRWLDKQITLSSDIGGKFQPEVALARVYDESSPRDKPNYFLIFGERTL